MKQRFADAVQSYLRGKVALCVNNANGAHSLPSCKECWVVSEPSIHGNVGFGFAAKHCKCELIAWQQIDSEGDLT